MKGALPASFVKKTKHTQYRDTYPLAATKLCLLGATDRDLAAHFGVCRETIINWKKNFPEFKAALDKGKKAADMEVVASLYQATLDRMVVTRQAIKCKEVYYDENGKRVEKERIEIVEVEKHLPADFRCQQFWLRNRNPAQWNEKYDEADDIRPRTITLNLGEGHDPLGNEAAG